ncbi:helix-turn-helix domain-containing protein [Siphonobacter sp.]|uniref:helix-turn-helix domain-containing protein n=1 Tax=Siphonobacter sp. TaxID=1869184 RepID=UPI003B3B552C
MPGFDSFVKVAYLKAGSNAVVDFKEYQLEQDALFFISPGQFTHFDESNQGTLMYYNRDFYCVEIHDKEVACDGILFHNVYDIPVVYLSPEKAQVMEAIVTELKAEFEQQDSTMEEMLRILLKSIIIKATRIWKQQHQVTTEEIRQEVEFSRKFSQLVEWHYTQHHTVAEYADLLNMTPKALNKRITRYSNTTPNDVIKNRIILEANRLLVHTSLSVKEIGYKLGYEDSSYFIRLFTSQTSASPQNFRLKYQQAI